MAIPLYGQLHTISYLIPTVTGLWRFRSLSRAMRVLTILCLFSCLDIVAQYFLGLWLGNNLILSHFYVALELVLLCLVFYWSVPAGSTRSTILTIGGLFIAVWVADLIFFFNPMQINTLTQMVERVALIVMAAVTLQSTMRDETIRQFERPVYWVAISVMLYSAGSLMAVGLGNQLLSLGIRYFDIAWNINWTLIIIANLLYTKGLLCKSNP
jgi:hypothetical protein